MLRWTWANRPELSAAGPPSLVGLQRGAFRAAHPGEVLELAKVLPEDAIIEEFFLAIELQAVGQPSFAGKVGIAHGPGGMACQVVADSRPLPELRLCPAHDAIRKGALYGLTEDPLLDPAAEFPSSDQASAVIDLGKEGNVWSVVPSVASTIDTVSELCVVRIASCAGESLDCLPYQ